MAYNAPRHIRSGWRRAQPDDRHFGYAAVVRSPRSEASGRGQQREPRRIVQNPSERSERILDNVPVYLKFLPLFLSVIIKQQRGKNLGETGNIITNITLF